MLRYKKVMMIHLNNFEINVLETEDSFIAGESGQFHIRIIKLGMPVMQICEFCHKESKMRIKMFGFENFYFVSHSPPNKILDDLNILFLDMNIDDVAIKN